MTDIRAAFDRLTPGAAWRNAELSGDPATDYERIFWQDQQQQKPSLAACQQALTDIATEQLQAEQERQAVLLAVEFTRPLDLVGFISADQTAIDDYIATNGVNAAIYALVRVAQYLAACKDRAKVEQ